MIRPFFFLLLLCTLPAFAAYEAPTITHTKFLPRTLVRAGLWGYLDVVGNLDKIVDNQVVVSGHFQYRLGEGNWTNLGNNSQTGKVWLASLGVNYRRVDFKDMTTASFELRVCLEGQCSPPYVVYFVPHFLRIMSPENAVITPFKRTLRFSLKHHQLGGMKFHIGKLDSYPDVNDISYSGKVEIDPGESCPEGENGDELACSITIPDSVMEKPGRYALTAVSSLGSSINHLYFDVASGYKIIKVSPPRIESPIQDVITLQVADENLTTRAVHISMATYPCPGHAMEVQIGGRDKFLIKLPPECMPAPGCGEMEFDIATPTGVERIKLPYQI